MNYEEFEKEIELIPLEKGKPTSWGEIRDSSDIYLIKRFGSETESKSNPRSGYHEAI